MEYKDIGIRGWMIPNDLEWLYQTSKKMDSIIEIGSWMGRSTHAILSGCNKKVFAIDHFEGSRSPKDPTNKQAKEINVYNEFLKNVGMFKNLEIIKKDSVSACDYCKLMNIKADMIFIDGSHKYDDVCLDIENWLPLCKKIISGHDYNYLYVRKAVDKMFNNYKINVVDGGTIWYINLN